ncbi:PTS sugar transporter subunit IIB [Pediococcus pentosaceus]|jgi:PTS system ascorbate-specific IIB component|uniref:PTS sugar transporter subunit IIB n=1 Tax=Pediococcus pentosaceus TaxID=1255 RepID=A0AB73HCJ6_PEDPE|nr:PTS sugar transporter subunit IIB [Pediococcus pentosaceus]KAF0467985.1 PTS ascorbate transporter subunit IIB [Pediococcus pentosaceus]MBF7102046.1 PTS sugar transporter subunit IIB [Pediococcus pentosaceus]MBF7114203.1 PTS sugar transporter subunit IIB [Pediococcus pentosaceus]MBF7128928.1 PTS sugar transporter subunit IIB [Pediococcus pentosaceus]MBF7131944.1 PTS sugar transporter subunit IIB [Pediococcus pentosaceus]
MKILVTCRNGMGTSTMLTVQVRNVASKNNWDIECEHASLDAVGSFHGDLIISLSDVAKELEDEGVKVPVIGINSLMDTNEIEQKMKPYIGK